MEVSSGVSVRKGAWSSEEDNLLRECVEQHGEGRWHQVPLRAGLNRCRKSCRLRWLNYLKPNIKRGNFAEDEVDLIIRLHKLLGNRWSLIAGRLPGRTANDVKNYWNTHLRKKTVSCNKDLKINRPIKITKANIIKPQPQTFSNNLFFWSGGETPVPSLSITTHHFGHEKDNNSLCKQPSTVLATLPTEEEERMWWERLLLDEKDINGGSDNVGSSLQGVEHNHTGSLFERNDNNENTGAEACERNVGDKSTVSLLEEGQSWWTNNKADNNNVDFPFDIGIWDLTEMDNIMI